ncbi:MAG: phosphotransferase [Rhodospirillales bacterium]|nr:phosphotransferase [Rhodospirillales bacterium]
MKNVRAQFERISQLKGQQDKATIERLGGLTNLVFKIALDGEAYILRIAGEGTEEYIDRAVEGHNAKVAADAGVSADVLFFDESDGLMLASFIEGETMSSDLFTSLSGSPARAARAFRKLHTSGLEFSFRFELFSMIDDYLKILNDLGATLPDGYHEVVKEAEAVRRALDAHPARLAPCHCDPLCENFIDDGERMWIIDWEYSGMNDPLWDLGDLSVEAGFTVAQDREMMTAYCNGAPSDAEFARMIIYKAMCDLLWTLWGLIQHANDNPVEDFWAYAVGRFERCKALMATPDFAEHLKAVEMG